MRTSDHKMLWKRRADMCNTGWLAHTGNRSRVEPDRI